MKTTASIRVVPNDLETVAGVYKRLMEQAKAIEQELEPYRAILTEAAISNGGVIDLGDYRVSVNEASRESISLKEAKAKLGRLLRPFLKITTFTQLRVLDR